MRTACWIIACLSGMRDGPGILTALLAAGSEGADGVLTDVVFTYDEIGALQDGTADVALMPVDCHPRPRTDRTRPGAAGRPDAMVDRVALGRLVVVVGESVRDRLGGSVRVVPVHGYPATQLVLAWLPAARSAASRLTAIACRWRR
ncbi:hypothetical protein [Streptomyces sp. NPDC058678]